MNHFLRILLVLIKQPFKRRAGFLDPVRSHLSVWFTDEDMLRHMTNSRYHSLADVAFVDWITRTRALRIMRARKWIPLVAYKGVTFHRVLKFPQRFVIETRIAGWSARFVVYEQLFRRRGETVARGLTALRFMDADTRLVTIDTLYAALGQTLDKPVLCAEAEAIVARLEAAADARAAARAQAGR